MKRRFQSGSREVSDPGSSSINFNSNSSMSAVPTSSEMDGESKLADETHHGPQGVGGDLFHWPRARGVTSTPGVGNKKNL